MEVDPAARTVLDLFDHISTEIYRVLNASQQWGLTGGQPGQHHSDLLADDIALRLLSDSNYSVLSEESGTTEAADSEGFVRVVVDPLDGSTNAAHGIPWFATSLCAVDDRGPWVALVRNQADGTTFEAVRGSGATRNGEPIAPTTVERPEEALIALSGYPAISLGWRQFRVLGAAALDLCAVASGVVDAYVDCSRDAHGSWDYLGGMLVCEEAGAVIAEAEGRPLVVLDHQARRTPVAGATNTLCEELIRRRSESVRY